MNFKKILASLLSVILIIGVIPGAVLAGETHEHIITVPTANASGSSDMPLIKIGTISDSHTDYGLQNSSPYIRTSYITALNALKAEGIDVLLHGGDITSDNEDGGGDLRWDKSVYDRTVAAYKTYSSAASNTGITLWACGNHDHEVGIYKAPGNDGDYDSYGGFMQMMIDTAGQPKHLLTQQNSSDAIANGHWLGAHFVIKGFDFIIINPPYGNATYYDDATLAWLDETLNDIGAEKRVFITGHYPLYDSRNMTRNEDYGIKGTNLTKFKNVLNKYDNAVYFYGHNHGDGDSTYISEDSFERITHYSENGAVIDNRDVAPSSFITSFMGSASFYKNSVNTDWLSAADPYIIQAQVVTVYADRLEFKVINCGTKTGLFSEPTVWATNGDGVYVEPTAPLGKWQLPVTIIDHMYDGATNKCNNFHLYYMDKKTGELKDDWAYKDADVSYYVNLKSGGHNRGVFHSGKRTTGTGIYVFPENNYSAVVQFTAPQDGVYSYEAPVLAYAKSGNGQGNKQVVFSVMRNGVIYDITQPNNQSNYVDTLSGTIELKAGDKLLFVADQYVKFTNGVLTSAGDYINGLYVAGLYKDITVSLIKSKTPPASLPLYSFDGSGINLASSGFSLNSNSRFSVVGIDLAGKKTLTPTHGTATVNAASVDAAVYSGVVIAAVKDSSILYGPFGSGNSGKKTGAAIAFKAPSNGTYNLTALLAHDYDYSGGKNYAIEYAILDKNFNTVFEGNTANVYTGGDVTDTYVRAAGTVYLKANEVAYLVFKAAAEANDTASDKMGIQVLSLSAERSSETCTHRWESSSGKCAMCGTSCSHSGAPAATCRSASICPTCGYKVAAKNASNHVDKNGTYTSNGNGTHSFNRTCCDATDVASQNCTMSGGVCSKCGYKPAASTTKPTTTKPNTTKPATTKPSTNTNATVPLAPPDPNVTTAPNTTPDDTHDISTAPPTTDAPSVENNVSGSGSKSDNSGDILKIVAILALVLSNIACVVVIVILISKKKK